MPKNSLLESLASLTSISSSKGSLSRPSTAGSLSSRYSRRSSTTSYNTLFGQGNGLDDVPKLIRTPWELERSKRSYAPRNKPPTPKQLPAHIFKDLPDEIYQCILQQLEHGYFEDLSGTCTSCYTKDLYSLALTSRAWERSARRQLYVLNTYNLYGQF
jgi:hypothetical protein